LLLYTCQKGHEDVVKYLIYKYREKIENFYNKNNQHHIEKDIIYEIYNKNNLNSKPLKVLIEICVPVLNSSSFIKKIHER